MERTVIPSPPACVARRRPTVRPAATRALVRTAAVAVALASALAARDWPTAKRHAHTLKGLAAQIGARTLANLAEQLEQALHQTPEAAATTELGDLPAQVDSELSALIAAIAAQHPSPAAPVSVAGPAAAGDVTAICAALERALSEDDFNAGRLLEANEALLRGALGADYDWIAEAIDQFNYAAALDWLREAQERMANASVG